MPKEVKIICDFCGKETEEPQIFSKKIHDKYFLNIYICKECYEKMFEKQIKRLEKNAK